MMKKQLAMMILTLAVFVGFAQARETHGTAAQAASVAQSVSTAQAASHSNTVNQFTPTLSTSSAVSAHGGGGTATITTNSQAPTVVAPALAVGGGSCMGSTSVGGSGVGFGFSVGSTWTDGDCNARSDAALLHNMGLTTAALQRLCERPELAKALKASGTYQCRDVVQ